MDRARAGYAACVGPWLSYAVLYSVEAERVEVFAVMHQRRHPDQWRR
ncbi:hypothetical protein DB30_06128 [Enhygromyxa salina]|uniref:Plasmid stabilization system protein n=1 Tax=Enhygromyxa salina TaxID=215803 RepID=A0A0C2CVG6_9BACT|nr:hypothetical protein DB30_06128 [Enhygromyxa salina]